LKFSVDLEGNLIQIQNELIWKTYRTGHYHEFHVYEPKKRLVAALPFKDRIVQHAICNVIEPLFEAKMIYDSYACRVSKGTHKGTDRVTQFLREIQSMWDKTYCLKCDVAKFFPNINHDILKRIIRRTIICPDTLNLLDEIINSSDNDGLGHKGLPIGNLTSQLFANVYLDQLDHYAKEVMQERFYVRYMDDFLFLTDNKRHLVDLRLTIESYLAEELDLRVNKKTSIFPVSQGIDFLGYRIWPNHRLLRKRSIKKFRRLLKVFTAKYASGKLSFKEIDNSVQSWVGHAKHADTYRLRRKVFEEFKLVRQS
jgi:retron-type reverse transcriptase